MDATEASNTLGKRVRQLADAVVQNHLMAVAASYLRRGRVHAASPDEALYRLWPAAFRAWFGARSPQALRAMDDLFIEFALRGLEPPYDAAPAEVAELRAEAAAMGPDDPALRQLVRAVLDGPDKPGH